MRQKQRGTKTFAEMDENGALRHSYKAQTISSFFFVGYLGAINLMLE